jgi:hypothetical protein
VSQLAIRAGDLLRRAKTNVGRSRQVMVKRVAEAVLWWIFGLAWGELGEGRGDNILWALPCARVGRGFNFFCSGASRHLAERRWRSKVSLLFFVDVVGKS